MLLFWAPVARTMHKAPPAAHPHCLECSLFLSLSLLLYHIFSLLHQYRTSQLHNTVSFHSLQRSFSSPSFPHLSLHPPSSSLLLTQSSDCIALHLHSSGGSSSCKCACPGSCCGCCVLYSHWAPCQTGKVVRIH